MHMLRSVHESFDPGQIFQRGSLGILVSMVFMHAPKTPQPVNCYCTTYYPNARLDPSLCVNIWRLRPAASAGKCPKEVSRPAGSKSEAPTAFSSLHFCLLRALDPMCVLKRPFARFPRIDHRSRDGGGICGEMKGILHQQHFSALSHERFFVAK